MDTSIHIKNKILLDWDDSIKNNLKKSILNIHPNCSDIVVCGSRIGGWFLEDSDLDVFLEYDNKYLSDPDFYGPVEEYFFDGISLNKKRKGIFMPINKVDHSFIVGKYHGEYNTPAFSLLKNKMIKEIDNIDIKRYIVQEKTLDHLYSFENHRKS